MTQDEILQYNKRCAEFLGFKYHKGSEYWTTMLWGGAGFTLRKMKFDSDWNWIMEVVEAIEKLKFNVRITIACITIENAFDNNSYLCPIYKFHSMQGEFESKKEAVVQAINEFLIWYEQNKTIKKSNHDSVQLQ